MLLLFIVISISYTGYSQYVYSLNSDSVKLTSDSGKNELIIENSTKTISGFLFNTGNGRTQFKKALTSIGTNKYLIGSDTLDIAGAGSGSAMTVSNQTANYTLQLADAGKLITQTTSATSTVTVPSNSSVAFAVGSKILVHQDGTGQVSIGKGSGVVINSPDGALKVKTQYGTATLIKTDTNKWILNGDLTNTVNTFETDAKKFIDSSGITDSVTKLAINNLVIQLKDSSLWGNFNAIYPMVGGSATSMKWNLKDPRNLDAAYRLTFSGSPTYASTGVLFPTTSDYADTHLADNALPAYNNNSIAYYSRTQNTLSGYDMGCADNVFYYNEFTIYHSGDATSWFGYGGYLTPASTKGLFMMSSTSTNVKRYENGVVTSSKGSAPTTGFTNLSILIGKVAAAPAGGRRECALASIGQGLTDAQAATFYNIVQNFETALGRN